MPRSLRFTLYILTAALLLSWYGFWLIEPINLATADIGRHITNGRLLVDNPSQWQTVLYENLYSYTHPNFPFTNHHWGSGLVFYLIHAITGFIGLHIFFILLSLATLLLAFDLARRQGSILLTSFITFLLIPMIASRTEVRPEAFSYFFFAVFLTILWRFRQGRISDGWLWTLVALQFVWVNLHSFFLVGLGLPVLFAIDAWLNRRSPTPYVVTAAGCLLMSCLNPHGYKSLLLPLTMFDNYGYQIVENQSIWFLENWGMRNPHFLIVKITVGLLALSLPLAAISRWRRHARVPAAEIMLAAVMSALSVTSIRNFPLLGLTAIPVLAGSLVDLKPYLRNIDFVQRFSVAVVVFTLGASILYLQYFQPSQQQVKRIGLGLLPEINAAAQYLRQNPPAGKVFNNYDIGGYLIYHSSSFPSVFVDNRPEAYPAEFFETTYIPMQTDREVWQQQLNIHEFSTIVYWMHDLTPWGQTFLASRLSDQNWVVKFADDYILILERPL